MATLFKRTGRPEQRKRRRRADRLGGMLEYELDALLVPGGAVGVFEGDEQVVAGRGRCSVDDKSPVDEQTRFQVGSVAKLFTATAAFALVKEHRLDLDSPVSDAIEERGDPGSLEGVTVRHLLSHRTGWAPDWFVDHAPEVPNDDTALAAFIDHVRCVPRSFQPGQVFSYDNAAYSVLGRAVEVSSGLPFEAALNELVAQPFGMEPIRFAREGLANELALGHQLVDGRIVEFSEATTALGGWNFPAFMAPAGGAVVSIADLLTFAQRHLDSPQLAEMRIPIATSGGQGEEICVGWHLKRIGQSTSFLHTGRGKGLLRASHTAAREGRGGSGACKCGPRLCCGSVDIGGRPSRVLRCLGTRRCCDVRTGRCRGVLWNLRNARAAVRSCPVVRRAVAATGSVDDRPNWSLATDRLLRRRPISRRGRYGGGIRAC